jgi:hypothetical protein
LLTERVVVRQVFGSDGASGVPYLHGLDVSSVGAVVKYVT